MDERVERHAEILVDHCTDVGPEDDVLVRATEPAEELVVALYEKLGERGARPTTEWLNKRASRAYHRTMAAEDYRTKDHDLAAMAETDVVIMVVGSANTAENSDVAPEKRAAAGRAKQPILEERLDTRWVITRHPTPADAQAAEMSTDAYEEFVYDAVNRDWDAQREFQARMAEILDSASAVRLVSGDETDLRLSVDGMDSLNDYGRKNMPGGEVATSPVVDSVEGTLFVDVPFRENGREVRGARLEFEDGEVVACEARRNEAALWSVVETDEGSRRVGELGIGMNRGIDRLTHTTLFDEKMGDTVHVALGAAMEECVPDDREFNESARHLDLLVDVSEDSRLEVDGEVVQRDGTFRFEDGFEA
ncbi:aminopeptidase [Halorussus gelatinilyticus]|uniref:Aminopeptidase n=1 Tax=Halorussus gelatinilyticus TaxID=2937524 RepID=A0A8U0IKW8_9EURY|nr:aminopeptidase [Halorussus gelatinilyticus]UPW01408.1 aminopeptidase [Halorussus gelatinilyticus]